MNISRSHEVGRVSGPHTVGNYVTDNDPKLGNSVKADIMPSFRPAAVQQVSRVPCRALHHGSHVDLCATIWLPPRPAPTRW